MDFHSAMETFAEAWVAANGRATPSALKQSIRPAPLEEIQPLQLTPKESRSQEVQGHTHPHPHPAPQGQMQPQGRLLDNKTTPSATSTVATVTTTNTTMTKNRTSKTPSPNSQAAVSPSVKSIPVHCIVEQTGSPESAQHNGADLAIEMDTYAILPSSTPFNDIVRTALTKIGYTTAEAVGAKGLIQIKNWKALTFDSVTENPDSSVEEILGELTSVATLRIKLSSDGRQHSVEEVKEKLLQFLLQHSQNVLASSGCPIEKHLLGLLSKGEYPGLIPDEIRQAFNRWYSEQTKQEGGAKDSKGGEMPPHLAYPALRSELINTPNSGYKTTRIRTSFDPDLEIPRLQQWFGQNQHPSREQMLTYLTELNALESRRDRKPLDLANIIYWFKNARAAVRRQSRSNEGGEDPALNDDTLDENLSTGTPEEHMPVLPNRNAIYVVSDPLHHWAQGKIMKTEGCGSPVLQIMPQSPEEEEKASGDEDEENDEGKEKRTHSVMNGDSDGTMEADGKENICENLPKRARRDSGSIDGEDESHDLSLKKEQMDDEYDSSSNSSPSTPRPASLPHPSAGMTLATTLSQPPPAHQALNMTVLPHALNMHYMGGTHSLYPSLDGSHILTPHQFKDLNSSGSSDDLRKKRSRVFIDPLSEIPKLEKWFLEDTHPSSYMIEKYTEELNLSEYRQRFPRLEPKNVQLWFKNHRAKVKRTRMESSSLMQSPGSLSGSPLNNNTTMTNNNEDLKETALCS